MKLIGKNSLSKLISWIILALTLLISYTTGRFILALVSYFFNLSCLKGIADKELRIIEDKTGNNYAVFGTPFGGFEFNGTMSFENIFIGILALLYYIVYFYMIYKIFDSFSQEPIFNNKCVAWLTRFSYYNLSFLLIMLISFIMDKKLGIIENVDNNSFPLLFHTLIAAITYYVLAFFKKANELQTEIDLTV